MKLAVLSLLVLTTSAFAQTQQEMNREAAADFAKADAALNKLYTKVLAALDDEGKKKLKAAQRAWVVFRDAEADLQADTEARGGTLAPLIYDSTRTTLTNERIKTFKEMLANSER
jgi:uncharacterized protein YecT (DUF1311 family)